MASHSRPNPEVVLTSDRNKISVKFHVFGIAKSNGRMLRVHCFLLCFEMAKIKPNNANVITHNCVALIEGLQ